MEQGAEKREARRWPPKIAAAIGWAWALISGSIGLLMFLVGPDPYIRVMGATMILSGLVVVPPLVRAARDRIDLSRPTAIPPVLAFIVLTAGMVFAGVIGSASPGFQAEVHEAAVAQATKLVDAGDDRAARRALVSVLRSDDPRVIGLTHRIDRLERARLNRDREMAAQRRLRQEADATAQRLARDPIARAEKALKEDRPENAMAALADVPAGDRDASYANLSSRAQAGVERNMLADRRANMVDEIDNNQIPRLAGLTGSNTTDPQVLFARLEVLDSAARYLESLPAPGLSRQQLAARERLSSTISRRQEALLPAFRQSFAAGLHAVLWDDDISVRTSGTRHTTIEFTGAMFVTNRNVRPVQEANIERIRQLRFRRSSYYWYRGSDSVNFTHAPLADTAVGYWQDGRFKPVQ